MTEPRPSTSSRGGAWRRSPLVQLTLARWRSFYRQPSAIFWTFGFPLLMALTLGVAFRNRPPEPVFAVVESSGAPGEAERLAHALEASGQVKAWLRSPAQAREELRVGKVALVVIPPARAGEARVYRFDPTRPESRLCRAVVDDVLQRADGRADATRVRDAQVTETGSRYIDFLIPGLIGINLMSSGLWGIGFVIVDMRTRKLIKRLLATPMRKSHFLLGFALMRCLFLVGELPILLGFSWLFFGVGVRGSFPLTLGIALGGALCFAGMGLLAAARARNTETANGVINLVTMPMFVCSGVFFSADRFPAVAQPIIRALPLTALNDALRAVMIDGAGLAQVARPVTTLALWGGLSFVLALRLFRWR